MYRMIPRECVPIDNRCRISKVNYRQTIIVRKRLILYPLKACREIHPLQRIATLEAILANYLESITKLYGVCHNQIPHRIGTDGCHAILYNDAMNLIPQMVPPWCFGIHIVVSHTTYTGDS